ncbi:hypothetical protein ACUN7V_05905 [Quadrisphaera oryzae]|uniref:hypothetical protein n=1 Tax=Quadrisphaera TaxID=317661 RepID=UPI001646F1DA|nr:hypothetical protein [Quadrisphaera sp. RL12-1S]MBC3761293.1 hypothetical protein [Quadrisphaera sp. RL12-1S]
MSSLSALPRTSPPAQSPTWAAAAAGVALRPTAQSSRSTDLRVARTPAEEALLAGLRTPGGSVSLTALSALSGWTFQQVPDVVAVRTGPDVTPRFAGGANQTSSSSTDGSVVTYFSTGTPPHAVKGLTVTYGPDQTPSQRRATLANAMDWLGEHLDDHQLPGGDWNRSLFDARA